MKTELFAEVLARDFQLPGTPSGSVRCSLGATTSVGFEPQAAMVKVLKIKQNLDLDNLRAGLAHRVQDSGRGRAVQARAFWAKSRLDHIR